MLNYTYSIHMYIIMHMLNKYISVQVTAKLVSCSLRAATLGFARGLKKSGAAEGAPPLCIGVARG